MIEIESGVAGYIGIPWVLACERSTLLGTVDQSQSIRGRHMRRAVALLPMSLFAAASALAQDRFVLTPDPEASPTDTPQDLTYGTGAIRASSQAGGFTFTEPEGASPNWRITIRAPGTSNLAPGCYERTRRFGTAMRPELNFTFLSAGCNSSGGRYRVLDLATDLAGNVTSIALDFNQQCGYGPAVAGQLRYNSTVPVTAEPYRAVIEASGSLSFNAAPGAIGSTAPGGAANITLSRQFLWVEGNQSNGASFRYVGPLPGSTNGAWTLDFAGPNSTPLQVANYPTATRYPFQAAGEAGLAFGYSAAGCNTLVGSFVVTAVEMDGLDNFPLVLSAGFDQRCPNASGPLTTGTIIYDGNVIGPTTLAPGDDILRASFEDGEVPGSLSPFFDPDCGGTS